MKDRRLKDEGPTAGTAGPSGDEKREAPILQQPAAAGKAAACSGCDKPFSAARKVRGTFTLAFHHLPTGRVGTQAVNLCGKCAAFTKHNRPYDLPGLDRVARRLELLVAAEPTGVPQ